MDQKHIKSYLRGYFCIILYLTLLISHEELLDKFLVVSWRLNGIASILEGVEARNIAMVFFALSMGLCLVCIYQPLKLVPKSLLFFCMFVLLGFCTTQDKVNHNIQFILYTLFFSLLVLDTHTAQEMRRRLSFFCASAFLPFFFSGLHKIMSMFEVYRHGKFSDYYLTTHVLSNQILTELKISPDPTSFVQFFVDNHTFFFPLFFLGIIFQVSSFWLVLSFPRIIVFVGFLSIVFFFITGFVVNVFFAQACLLVFYLTFAFPHQKEVSSLLNNIKRSQ